MAVETFSFVTSLDATLPASSDQASEGANHLRGIKTALKNTFPNLNGVVTANSVHLSNPVLKTAPGADALPYYDSANTANVTSFPAFARSLVASNTAAAALTTLGIAGTIVPVTGGTYTGQVNFNAGTTQFGSGAGPTFLFLTDDTGNRAIHNNDSTIGLVGADGGWKLRVYDDGSLWTSQLGDLNSRIENRAAAFAATRIAEMGSNYGVPGYVRLSNGLMIAWGIGQGDQTIAFAAAFPNACLSVTATIATSFINTNYLYSVQVDPGLSTTGFTGRARYQSGSTTQVTADKWNYIAIGF